MKFGNIDLLENISLKEFHTFGIEVQCKFFVELDNETDIIDFAKHIDEIPKPIYFLGGGSNSLFTQDFEGTIVHINNKGIDLVEEDDSHILIRVGAGEVWDDLVDFCVENEYSGIENLKLIPGQVGTTPIQNIGAYGVEAKDCIDEVEYINLADGEIYALDNTECNFGYRDSIFKHELKGQFIIVSVLFKLSKTPNLKLGYGAIIDKLKTQGINSPSIADVANVIKSIRSSKLPDPKDIGNAGSFFKNPVIDSSKFEKLKSKFPDIVSFELENGDRKIAAGWMIDFLGWKSKKHHGAAVHSDQALVLINKNQASGKAIWELAQKIQADVKKHFGIDLEAEVNKVN